MKRYAVTTLGCKVNQYESQQLSQALEQLGLTAADRKHPPEILIVNTCCVTGNASAKSRQNIHKLLKKYPAASVFVTGCLPVGQDQELTDLENTIIVKDKKQLPAIINQFMAQQPDYSPTIKCSKTLTAGKIKNKNKTEPAKTPSEHPESAIRNYPKFTDTGISGLNFTENLSSNALPLLTRYSGQCRAFLKVQDGCDAYCTYCIIPKIRTNVCNKPTGDVIAEAKNLISAGHKEIILTGIFLGAYGQKTARRKKWNPADFDSLARLIDSVAAIEGLERLRLSSLEPLDVTDRLLEVMTSHANVAPHLHVPLQSGSQNILRKMARQYSIEDYRHVIEKVKKAFDRPAITTDIIVGFPGEAEGDFQQTIQVARESGFTKIHVFPFSVRKGTPAEKLAALFGKVSAEEIRSRCQTLHALDTELQNAFRRSCKGLRERVLVDKINPPQGLCGRYFTVNLGSHAEPKKIKHGQMVDTIVL